MMCKYCGRYIAPGDSCKHVICSKVSESNLYAGSLKNLIEDIKMDRSSPSDMRRALQAADALKKAGVLFVPMPVLHEEDHDWLVKDAKRRLEVMIESAEKERN